MPEPILYSSPTLTSTTDQLNEHIAANISAKSSGLERADTVVRSLFYPALGTKKAPVLAAALPLPGSWGLIIDQHTRISFAKAVYHNGIREIKKV